MSEVIHPKHPLNYWLSPELAEVTRPEAPSRLRQLADTQGTLAAGWSSAISGGPVLVLTGGFISIMSGGPAWVTVLGLLGAALTVLGVLSWKRVRSRLPNTDTLLITRGPAVTAAASWPWQFWAASSGCPWPSCFLRQPSEAQAVR